MAKSVTDLTNTFGRINDTFPCNSFSKKIYSLIPSHQVFNMIIINLIIFSAINTSKAAGVAVLEQSVRGLGNAYSGGTAGGEDISTIYYNPAGLSQYSGTEIVTGGHFITPEIKFKSSRSSDLFNRPLTGGNGGNAGEKAVIPNLYIATDLNTAFRFGLGITVPFGLGAHYADDWQGRYEAIDSQLKTIDT